MGDVGRGDASGVVMAERPVRDNPDPASINKKNWAIAEEIIQEVISDIHPTMDSQEKRNNVIDYVQRLLNSSLGFEVFPYGSVPLKTYLPDGDIDLTILSTPGAEGSWAADVLSILQREEKNENAEYKVKDTQFIDAEVKLVKCLVQNIVIDISFNQFGGLCTLCFLEQVDRLVGKDHLFKQGIILIKAWCYYESRILGAHHGLLSTYALEILVLYTFHLFQSSLDGPLSALYKFLDYFSKFDWENYCISLNGPVCKSSLPEIVAEMPRQEGNQLMLSEELLKKCMEMFSMPFPGQETNSRVFSPKHLNIIDPLKEYNNLGRSVHRGNSYRIRSAFRYGARKLGRVLLLPKDKIADEIKNFFSNTLQRHGQKYGSSTQDYTPVLCRGESIKFLSYSHATVLSEDHIYSTDFANDGSFLEERYNSFHSDIYAATLASSQTMPGHDYSVYEGPPWGYCLNGDGCDLATSDYSPCSNLSVSSFGQYFHVPQLYLSKSSLKNGHCCQIDSWMEHRDGPMEMVNGCRSCSDNLDGYCSCSSAVSSPKTNSSENSSLDFREKDLGSADDTDPLNPLADLSGDYDSHIRSLLHGPFLHKLALSDLVLPHTPMSPSLFLKKAIPQSMPSEQNSFAEMNKGTIFISQPASSIVPCISAFSFEEKQKTRGTGTYLPVMNNSCKDGHLQGHDRASGTNAQSERHNSCKDGHLQGHDRASGTNAQSERQSHGNVCNSAISETHNSAKGGREVFRAWCPVKVHKKPGLSCQSHCNMCSTSANGFSNSLERIEFGSIGNLVDEVISASCNTCTMAAANNHRNATSGREKAEKRVADGAFGLKDEEEFPPLSV